MNTNILLIVLALLAVVVIYLYNRLVRLRQNLRESWAAIDTELKRRYDLIPNLVETVKGYAGHERQTLEAVMTARGQAAAVAGSSPAAQAQSDAQLAGALRQLFAVAEAYPDLKANTQFTQLQTQLADTETRISQARRFYNANVRELNTAVQIFPTSLLARPFGFQPAEYFEAEGDARAAVGVKF